MKQPTRILLLDNYDLVRKGLTSLLSKQQDMLVAGEAKTLSEAHTLVSRTHPHVALIEMHLPDASGMEACRRLLAADPQLRILVLTNHAEDTMVAAAIRSGAHGYLLKDVKTPELLHAIRIVAGGRGYLDPRITQHALRWIRTLATPKSQLHGMQRLSPQERLIMPLLATGKTNKEIAGELHLSDKTIKNYLANIFDKLGVNRRSEAVAKFLHDKDQAFFS
jgi:DNA-binding NarL/FixJ family response regulator